MLKTLLVVKGKAAPRAAYRAVSGLLAAAGARCCLCLQAAGCKGCLVDMLQPPVAPHPTKGAEAAQLPTCHRALPFLGEPKVPNLFLGVLRPVGVGVALLHNVKELPVAGNSRGLSSRLALAPSVLNPAVASGHGCWAIPDGIRLLLNGGS